MSESPKKKTSASKNKKKNVKKEPAKKTIKVRKVLDLQIVFFDSETTYVCHPNGINLYHTWFLPKDGAYYNHVRYFKRALLELRTPTITHINHLAYRHGLVVSAVEKLPDLTDKIVKIVDTEPEADND